MTTDKPSMFVLPDGRNVFFTFCLVSSLFLLWGFCNGMIDTMDKHFQKELGLSLSQSAWVQFAHWMGYFLMSIPAGWLATRLGYRGGIIAGLLFAVVGRMVYDRAHTRNLLELNGISVAVPRYAAFLMFCAFGGLGLPGLAGTPAPGAKWASTARLSAPVHPLGRG